MVLNVVKNAVLLDLDDTKTDKVSVFDPSQQCKERGKYQVHDD